MWICGFVSAPVTRRHEHDNGRIPMRNCENVKISNNNNTFIIMNNYDVIISTE